MDTTQIGGGGDRFDTIDRLFEEFDAERAERAVPRGTRVTWNIPRPVRACASCGKPRDRGPKLRYCRACHNAYARAHRPKQIALSDEAKKRANCRAHTKMLVKRGQLVKTPCTCGARDVTAKHLNYDDPRAIEWICTDCRSGVRREVAA